MTSKTKVILGISLILNLLLGFLLWREYEQHTFYQETIDRQFSSAFGEFSDRLLTVSSELPEEVYYALQTESMEFCINHFNLTSYKDDEALNAVLWDLFALSQKQTLNQALSSDNKQMIGHLSSALRDQNLSMEVSQVLNEINVP